MTLEELRNTPWIERQREIYKWLDNHIDIADFMNNKFYVSLDELIYDIYKAYPTTVYIQMITIEEFNNYLNDRYEINIKRKNKN